MGEREAELCGEIRAIDSVLTGLYSEEQSVQVRAIIASVEWVREQRIGKLAALRASRSSSSGTPDQETT